MDGTDCSAPDALSVDHPTILNMEPKQQKLFDDLADAVVNMNSDLSAELCRGVISAGINPVEAVQKGLAAGMTVVGEKFEAQEYFVPQLLLASDAMYAGLDILKPVLKGNSQTTSGKIVIGVVEGDTHDIGKSLVKIMLEANGYMVFDLGTNVSADCFIDAAEMNQAQMICISALLTTTMSGMSDVISRLNDRGLRDKYKVVIGGSPVTQEFCQKIGADGYSPDAVKAVRLVQSLFQES